MLISYLVPVYNVEKYIRQCLDSILAQKGADFEVVLLDDGSTDTSGAICDEYARAYPEIIRVLHKENEGLFATRRRGFREAKGDWFVCVDSDDYIVESHLQTIAKAIREHDCDMVLFDYESFFPDGHTEPSGIDLNCVQIYEGTGKRDIYKKRLLKNKYNNMWSKAIKRSVLDFDTDYSIYGVRNMCEDAIQSYELYTRAQKIVFVPQALYAYRRSIASISSSFTMDYWHAIRVSDELGWKYVQLWEVPETVAQAYGARCICDYCDFLTWLLTKAKMDEAQRKAVFSAVFLENTWFSLAAKRYQKKYLATKYLRLRNPMIVKSICKHRSWRVAQEFFKLEQLLHKHKR